MTHKKLSARALFELGILFFGSIALVLAFFLQPGEKNYLSLFTSLLGMVAILMVAKGMIIGQYFTFVYGLLYALLSYLSGYYGECILCAVTILPSATLAVISWTRHPSKERGKVKVNKLSKKEYLSVCLGAVALTFAAYFVLRALHTEELVVSTVSFVTSLSAAYLLIRRSPFYALCYIANDLVLIALWSLALARGECVLPSVICFCIFLVNDSYGFFNWRRRGKTDS